MFGKSTFLDLEPLAMIHADSASFLTSTDDRIKKYSLLFGFSWTNPSLNSQWYIRNECSDMAKGLQSRFRFVTSSTLQGLF